MTNPHEIKSRKLQRLLKKNGLEKLILVKDDGYFWVTSNDDEVYESMRLDSALAIYVNSFNQLTTEQWLDEIKNAINYKG